MEHEARSELAIELLSSTPLGKENSTLGDQIKIN